MLHKDKAVCLRKVDYSETSQIVTLFARNAGKISAIAKGSKRAKSAFAGAIELFSFGDIGYAESTSGKLNTLTEFDQQPRFRLLNTKLFELNCAIFAAELLENFVQENDPHPDLFDSFTEFLNDVQQSEKQNESISLLILFELSLLAETGLAPVLKECVNCASANVNKWKHVYFSSAENGLLCPDCEQSFAEKIRLSMPCASCLADIKMIHKADKKTLEEIEKVLIYHFREKLGKEPKMAKYFTGRQ